jgi:cell division protein FtsB
MDKKVGQDLINWGEIEGRLNLITEQKIQEGLRVEIEKTKETTKKIYAQISQLTATTAKIENEKAKSDYSMV